jgi:hypothetical protein
VEGGGAQGGVELRWCRSSSSVGEEELGRTREKGGGWAPPPHP